ncbi:hypothetical protein AB0L00_08900 [Actinoallomurus sp. NPDC052308]|uniref:hypothetical protein n=1 Tax=Actinoallomurus sp. NPDC052308 TaxID=3155530 RepID=UPI00341E2FFB
MHKQGPNEKDRVAMPDERSSKTQIPVYTGRTYFVGWRRLKPQVPVNGRVYVRRSLWRGTVLTYADGRVVFRTRRRHFIIDGGWVHA